MCLYRLHHTNETRVSLTAIGRLSHTHSLSHSHCSHSHSSHTPNVIAFCSQPNKELITSIYRHKNIVYVDLWLKMIEFSARTWASPDTCILSLTEWDLIQFQWIMVGFIISYIWLVTRYLCYYVKSIMNALPANQKMYMKYQFAILEMLSANRMIPW